jgi:homoserine dehydrogenase
MNFTVGVGLLGCGTVGAHVADRLLRERAEIERRGGVGFELRAIAIQDPRKRRPDSLDRRIFTRNARSVVEDPSVDVIVELIGGTAEAAELIESALERGRHVVTANKDLIGTQGPRLQALAALRGALLQFESAVGGATPIVRTLDEALAGDSVRSVSGVINGTCTAILAAMEDGAEFGDALAMAQRRGYAESDPASDLDGGDAAHKLAIVAQLAFGLAVISPRIHRTGIRTVSQRDVARARMLGYRIRLVAAARRTEYGIAAEVAPVLVPEVHEFARTSDAENVVKIVARHAGELVLRGCGAGGRATSSAVLGDIVAVLRALGDRRDVGRHWRARPLQPALEIAPLFERFGRTAELAPYPIWDDAAAEAPLRSLVNA